MDTVHYEDYMQKGDTDFWGFEIKNKKSNGFPNRHSWKFFEN